MIDFRYHAVSILAIFFALAIGIVLGSVISEKGAVQSQQTSLIRSIQSDLGKLRAEATKQERKNRLLDELSTSFARWARMERLKGTHTVVVNLGGSDEDVSLAVRSVTSSGGTVRTVAVNLEALSSSSTWSATAAETLDAYFDSLFAQEASTVAALLTEAGIVTDLDERVQAQYVVFVLGSNTTDLAGRALELQALKKHRPVVLSSNMKTIADFKGLVGSGGRVVFLDRTLGTDRMLAIVALSLVSPGGLYGTYSYGGTLVPEAERSVR